VKPFFFLLSIVFFLSACKKENGSYDASLTIKPIYGIECRNSSGDLYAIIGSPNLRLKDKETGPYNYSIITIANPNYEPYYNVNFHSGMYVFIESYLPVNYAHLWVEKARYFDNPSSTVNYLGAEYLKANAHVIDKDSLPLVLGHNSLALYVEPLTPGYYRLYLQINDELLWDNLAININPF